MQPLLHPATFRFDHKVRTRWWDWSVPYPDRDVVLQASFGLPYRHHAWRPFDAPVKYMRYPSMHPMHQLDVRKLGSSWQIRDAESAIETATALVECRMHSKEFDALLGTLHLLNDGVPFQEASAFLGDLASANHEFPPEYQQDFADVLAVVSNPLFAEVNAPPVPRTSRAYDIMRLEASAALAVELGYIDNATYQPFAQRAVEQLQRYYSSWAEVAAGFWWGRLIWVADNIVEADARKYKSHLQHFNADLNRALTDPDSPWRRFPLHA